MWLTKNWYKLLSWFRMFSTLTQSASYGVPISRKSSTTTGMNAFSSKSGERVCLKTLIKCFTTWVSSSGEAAFKWSSRAKRVLTAEDSSKNGSQSCLRRFSTRIEHYLSKLLQAVLTTRTPSQLCSRTMWKCSHLSARCLANRFGTVSCSTATSLKPFTKSCWTCL